MPRKALEVVVADENELKERYSESTKCRVELTTEVQRRKYNEPILLLQLPRGQGATLPPWITSRKNNYHYLNNNNNNTGGGCSIGRSGAIDANNKTREAAAEMDDTKVVIAATQQQQQPPPFLPGGR